MNTDTPRSPVPLSSSAEDLMHSLLGLGVVTAVYADGRAHILGLPDSFFTPWHAFFYGGLGLMVLWLGIIGWRAARRVGSSRPIVIPVGYRPAVAGAIVFAVGGVADMVWHLVFGVEFGIDALLSPSHLILFVGGALLLSGPLLAARKADARPTIATRIPALLSIIGITAVGAFALGFLSAFISDAPTMVVSHAPEGTPAHVTSEGLASAGLGSFILTTLLLVAPTIYIVRRGLWFPGAAAALITVTAAYAVSLTGFQNPMSIATAFIAGALLDLIILVLRGRVPGRGLELIAATALPLLVWPAQLVVVSIQYGLGWSEAMTAGVVLLSAAVSVATVLAIGRAEPMPKVSATTLSDAQV